MTCLCVSLPRRFSSPSLRRLDLSSLPACRICCLLALVHLQTARFPCRCPETGENSTASGLSVKPTTANAVYSLGCRRRPYPVRYYCIVFPCVGSTFNKSSRRRNRTTRPTQDGIPFGLQCAFYIDENKTTPTLTSSPDYLSLPSRRAFGFIYSVRS